MSNKKKYNKTRHGFLLTFFKPDPEYQVIKMNGYVLVKQFNGLNNEWEVAIYTEESWSKVEQWKEGMRQPS